jgi:hypothetical protein
MKIEIKKNLIIFRNPHEWEIISKRLVKEYGPSIMISWKLKRELNFSVRRHKGLVKWADDVDYKDQEEWLEPDLKNRYHYEEQVHLDFYSEAVLSWFVLKYINV